MSPSPVMRLSLRKDLRPANHMRRHSLESGLLQRDREDDDLALFNEAQDNERNNFLLNSSDNFDDIFSTKLRYFSNHKIGMSAPSRGERSDLLNDDASKNDYEWLITPPETPLFRSLDDEAPSQVRRAHAGRCRSRPIPISPPPTMERGPKSSRGSASPHRRSPSPRPSKPFSATRSSPPGHFSPSRGSSPPPRSSTPTPRRILSSATTPSPVKMGRGSSAPPKIKAWQSSIPGFSSEAPPNLRTSLADRPASYVRGSSPASRSGRKSRSPVPSRGIGSPRGSGGDSQHSAPIVVRDIGTSKKPTKGLSSSTPKRSSDLARQMDRKSPPDMFRTLLSSVPSSTLHALHATSPHYSLSSKPRQVGPSFNLAKSGPHDDELSESNRDGTTSDSFIERDSYADISVLVTDDHTDDVRGENDNKISLDLPISRHGEIDSPSKHDIMHTDVTIMDAESDFLDASGPEVMVIACSICGILFDSSIEFEAALAMCRKCKDLASTTNLVETSDPLEGKNHIDSTRNISAQSTEDIELTFSSRLVIKQLRRDEFDSNSAETGASQMAGKTFTLRSRSFTASNTTSFDEFSCARDSSNSKKSTFSASMSSSFELGRVSRQAESRLLRQWSCPKSDVENYRSEMATVHISTGSSVSGASVPMMRAPSEDGLEEKTCPDPHACTNTEIDELEESKECFSDIMNVEALPVQSQEEDVGPLCSCADRDDDVSEVVNPSVCEIVEEDRDVDGSDTTSCMNETQDEVSAHDHPVLDESRILSEDGGETKQRNLMTLEETTDAILFCSSIVHNLAYRAANIAIDKENPPAEEALRPTLAVLSGPDSKRRDNAHLSKRRARQKKPEMEARPRSSNGEADENSSPILVGARNDVDGLEPPKLESKCNCTIM